MKSGLVLGASALATTLGLSLGSSETSSASYPLAAASYALPDGQTEGGIDVARLDARIERLMDEGPMVGLAVGVVENGHIRLLKGYGERSRGSGDPVGTDTRFRWASVSKGVAGSAVALLAEQDRLSLDLPVANYSSSLYLPGGNQESATLRDVLSHRLGLWRNAYDNKLENGARADDIRRNLILLPQICPLGQCYSYQNVAFDTSSEAVEKVTGQSYGVALDDLLFRPLGMDSASVTMEALEADDDWARPHNRGGRTFDQHDGYYRVPAAGGVNSSIRDLTIWMQAQMGRFPSILPDEVRAETFSDLIDTPSEYRRYRGLRDRVDNPTYGLGWRMIDYGGRRLVGHRGGIDGYRAFILFDPETDTGIVALWNSSTSRPMDLQFELMDEALGLDRRDHLELDS